MEQAQLEDRLSERVLVSFTRVGVLADLATEPHSADDLDQAYREARSALAGLYDTLHDLYAARVEAR